MENGTLKTWQHFKIYFNCTENMYFRWRQIIGSIPGPWKRIIQEDQGVSINKGVYNQHFLRVTRQLTLDRMTSKELYNIMITKLFVRPKSEITLQNLLNIQHFNWSKIYNLTGEITIDTYSRMFNFKLNHNILYLNKSLTRMGILNNSLCSFCNIYEETPLHIFYECNVTVQMWRDLQFHYKNIINLPDLTPQSAFFDFLDLCEDRIIVNNLLLIFKITLYQFRIKKYCTMQMLL